jgi:NADPH:quinone reductase-like Zn-dependent oxidoreductase
MAETRTTTAATMRAFVAPKPCKPEGTALVDMPIPVITEPRQVLVRVHASTLTPSELKIATGMLKSITKIK